MKAIHAALLVGAAASFAGLRTRGGFTVDAEWKGGKVVNYRITSPEPREMPIRINGDVRTVRSETP